MNGENVSESIFAEDEMNLIGIDAAWDAEELLEQEGIFFLKDVVKLLRLQPARVKQHARRLDEGYVATAPGESPSWKVMGLRKVFDQWIVRMKVFAPYYRRFLLPPVAQVQPDWDGNVLLRQKGLFRLVDVCEKLPFSPQQLRYQANKSVNSRGTLGIWKDLELNTYVVDMEQFSGWVAGVWRRGFH